MRKLGATRARLFDALPNAPRIAIPARQAELTARYLQPELSSLEACMLELRKQLDPVLERRQPVKLGKPYPLGQCLEISLAVQKRLSTVTQACLPTTAAIGLRALRVFQRRGGSFRQVWGDLRGQYFQNAFQLGTLYVDVANDTVTPTKPKVEILPLEEAQFVPVRNYRHFSKIARSYWKHEIYPNHVLPALAPHCPLIHVYESGQVCVHDATHYMLAMTRIQDFLPSEDVLRDKPMPFALFESTCQALKDSRHKLPSNPEQGRVLSLKHCRLQRNKRWHQESKLVPKIIQDVHQINLHLQRWHNNIISTKRTMPIIKIDNHDYDLEGLSSEAKAQLQNIQFVDQEITRLQAQLAVMQTARNTYVNALKAALPVLKGA